VILALAVRDDVIAHAREAAPDECCGILIGTPDGVSAAVRAVNRDARAAGLDIVGFYHSHPHSAATPSPTDLAEASYVGCLYLIVGLAGDSADVKVYRFSGERFEVIDVTSG
jgi:proteasome lid subunit RPN8/RPN11